MITQEENLILQSYITTSLLAELGNNNFFQSDYFDAMKFGQPTIKEILKMSGVDNQGCAIMSLYAMLVVPYELIRSKHQDEFTLMNEFLISKTIINATTYHLDPSVSDLMYHLRNAVAHCRVSFVDGKFIVFEDFNQSRKKQFSGKLSLIDLSAFIHKLQLVIQMKVVKDIQSGSS